MKNKLLVPLVLFTVCLTAYASMSDPSAYKAAKMRWGGVAMVGQSRCLVSTPFCDANSLTYWTKQVGFASPKCVNEFTVVGKGLNTWDAAFADADANPEKVQGPYAGMLTVQVGSYDASGVVDLTLYIDGVAQNTIMVSPTQTNFTGSWAVDTTQLTNDYHVVCAQGHNIPGLLGKLDNGIIFRVDQTTGTTGSTWAPGREYPSFGAVVFNGKG